ncbi:MAG: hypothetical protein B6229_08495 [Spirochaetaceae bacterium 4572_7]|nr:MAG: hypothetical protein B6229_08495 [Spirochaetaceae bacterium 4572_7]
MINQFKRKEKKYVIDADIADSIKETSERVVLHAVDKDIYRYANIKTIYLDNDDYLIYHIKKNKNEIRYKIRIREYKNKVSNHCIWVELKEKINNISYKNRFKIKKKYLNDFLDGKDLLHKVYKVNKNQESKRIKFLYNKIQELIKEHNFIPKFAVEYSRCAFEKGLDNGLRLTFDSDLCCYPVNKDNLFSEPVEKIFFNQNKAIMEVKSRDKLPTWFDSLKKENEVKRSKFSKFVFGLESLFTVDNEAPLEIHNNYIAVGNMNEEKVDNLLLVN